MLSLVWRIPYENLLSLWPKEPFLDFFLRSLSSKWHGGSSFILLQPGCMRHGMSQGWIQFSTTTLVIVKSGIRKEKPLPFLKYRATWMAHLIFLIRRKIYSNPHFFVPFLHLSVSKSMEFFVLIPQKTSCPSTRSNQSLLAITVFLQNVFIWAFVRSG